MAADREPPVLLMSACLCGVECRLDGRHGLRPQVVALRDRFRLVPVCPEQLGGLPTPRPAAEVSGGAGAEVLRGEARVLAGNGEDVTEAFVRGARQVVAIAALVGAAGAVLKARSPSCGVGEVYDGTFSHTVREGSGVAAAALRNLGLAVWTEEDAGACIPALLGNSEFGAT